MSKADFPDAEFVARRVRLAEAMQAAEVDLFLVFHPASIHWLTGCAAKSYQTFQCLVVDARRDRLVMVTREAEQAEFAAEARIDALHCWSAVRGEDGPGLLLAVLEQSGARAGARIGMEVPAHYLHPAHDLRLRDGLDPAPRALPDLIADLRAVRSPREIALLRRAAAVADLAIDALRDCLAVGVTETTLAAGIYRAILEAGAEAPPVPLNLVSGPRAAFSHGAPTARRLATGESGNAEFCVPWLGHAVSIGRCFVLGKPGPRLAEAVAAVREAKAAMVASIADGVPATAPHEAAVAVLRKAGLDGFRVHTNGYAVASAFPPATGGPPGLVPDSRHILRAGMVLSLCPNVFVPEAALGVRVVDNVIVTSGGAEILSRHPDDLIVA